MKQFNTCESKNCPSTDDGWHDDFDNDNVGVAELRGHHLIKSVVEEDALFLTNPSSLTVVSNKEIHHPTVVIGKDVFYFYDI